MPDLADNLTIESLVVLLVVLWTVIRRSGEIPRGAAGVPV